MLTAHNNIKLAICVIAYNRLDSVKRLLESLESAHYEDEVSLIISIDKSNTTIVSDFASSYIWKYGPKRVIVHDKNLGLRLHVLSCGRLLEEYDALVVLEDDISVSPAFYSFAKRAVEKFRMDKNIAGISLYNFPLNYHNLLPFTPLKTDSDIFLMQTAQSWGQVWMREQWHDFMTWYEKNNSEFSELPHLPKSICSWPKSSWLKYHTKYCIENNKFFVYPYISFSTNNSDVGTHNDKQSTFFQSNLFYGIKKDFNLNPEIKYDGFFESLNLSAHLNIAQDDLCIDFYGDKMNKLSKRYYLTRLVLPYKILASYGLIMKPYEWNIIKHVHGNDLFLYDTSEVQSVKMKESSNKKGFNEYMYAFAYPKAKLLILLSRIFKFIKKHICCVKLKR